MNDPIKTAKREGRVSKPIPVVGAAGWAPGSPEPQFEIDRQAGSRGDVAVNSWLRGGGEDATRMPNFDHSGPSGHTKKGK